MFIKGAGNLLMSTVMMLFMVEPLFAGVIDSFACNLEYSHAQGLVEGTGRRLTAVRREIEREDLQGRNIKFFKAETDRMEFEFGVDGEMYSAAIRLRYYHAVEFDSEGHAIRAAQSQCHERVIILPDLGLSDGCNPGWFEDPFSGQAWNSVEITADGIPQFDTASFPQGVESLDIRCELISSENQ